MTGRSGSCPWPTPSSSAGTDDLSNIRREALLTWHGRRLLDDFAPRHALGVFDKARSFRDSKELQAAVEKAKTLTGARLTVELTPRELTIDEEPDVPLSMAVGRRGELPEGDAVAFVSAVNSSALSIKEKASQRSAIEGTLVPITRGDPSRRVEYAVEREEAAASAVNVKIRPGAFYRGHIFPADVATSEATVQRPTRYGADRREDAAEPRRVRATLWRPVQEARGPGVPPPPHAARLQAVHHAFLPEAHDPLGEALAGGPRGPGRRSHETSSSCPMSRTTRSAAASMPTPMTSPWIDRNSCTSRSAWATRTGRCSSRASIRSARSCPSEYLRVESGYNQVHSRGVRHRPPSGERPGQRSRRADGQHRRDVPDTAGARSRQGGAMVAVFPSRPRPSRGAPPSRG